MGRIEKTVFLSYRRTNAPWALAIFQYLTHHGFDVFFDFSGIASGAFESVILANINSRAHFIVLLTPSALENCGEPGDWLRREIETALDTRRNVVPIMLESFDFGTPAIAGQLTDSLAPLKDYNALRVPTEYFLEAMDRLCNRYLNVPLDGVLHPASLIAQQAAKRQQEAAKSAPPVQEGELTAQAWFERGLNTKDLDEKIRCYSAAIRLNPDYITAFNNRGIALKIKGDVNGARRDYNEAIRLQPDYPVAINNLANLDKAEGDLEKALKGYSEAIRLNPEYAMAFYNRGETWKEMANYGAAIVDYQKYLDLGGGKRDGDQSEVEQIIRELRAHAK
jgi:tetratricopeptide (TPR) repeat protein